MASYQLAKYLAKLLAPMNTAEYTVNSTKSFLESFMSAIPENNILISFDVTSSFNSVPLDFTIDIILRRIYTDKKIQTSITGDEMRELFLLCTRNIYFTFNDKVYVFKDGVAMGSPLGPVIAGIFMV
eukprot:gene21192-23271_t